MRWAALHRRGMEMFSQRRAIGILGGMGPAATVDLFAKIVALTPASCDQEHVPVLVHADPRIPDRSKAIETASDAPFLPMLRGIRKLERGGADIVAIPCNTAHHWHQRLVQDSRVPILHIVDAVLDTVVPSEAPFALMATRGTVSSGLYRERFAASELPLIAPDEPVQQLVDAAIAAVKGGRVEVAQERAEDAARRLLDAGTKTLLLACTELPVALRSSGVRARCLDATEALARACVKASLDTGPHLPRTRVQ